jgi:hypothetical protein
MPARVTVFAQRDFIKKTTVGIFYPERVALNFQAGSYMTKFPVGGGGGKAAKCCTK